MKNQEYGVIVLSLVFIVLTLQLIMTSIDHNKSIKTIQSQHSTIQSLTSTNLSLHSSLISLNKSYDELEENFYTDVPRLCKIVGVYVQLRDNIKVQDINRK